MSTSLLYQAFGVRGYQHVSTEHYQDALYFSIDQRQEGLCCSACGSHDVTRKGRVVRYFRSVPIGDKPVFVVFPVPRVACNACGRVRQVEIAFAEPKRSYTRKLERLVLELSRRMTIKDVAEHLRVGWDMVKEIQKRYLKRRFEKPKLKRLRRIAIDEISIARGYRFLTIVMDLDTGAVVFVGDGKKAESLAPFWKRLRASGAKVKAVAIDMSLAYIEAVFDNLPKAQIVFDHFHIIKLFNEKLTDLRRELYREATDKLHKKVLKGSRWLLLKNPENLNSERNEKQRLQDALHLNESLALAYYLKEDLRQIWSQPDKESAGKFLDDWIRRAIASGVRILHVFAQTLMLHRYGILGWYDHPITTGPLEGTNNKIKTMKRQAYGFRDREFFKLKILGLHETKYALVG
jgi:transposase